MESLRERAIAAYEKRRQLAPHYMSVKVENWVADEFGIDCDPVVWEGEHEGEVDLGELTLWVRVWSGCDSPDAHLSWRCPRCGHVDKGQVDIENLADLGKALLETREFCSKCGKSYARD